MRIIRYDSTDEKLVLAGMITSGSVLAQLAPVWNPKGLFASKWMNLIAKWCFSHYEDYKQPPGSHIIHLVGDWAQKRGQDQIEDLNAIERLLDEINEMYKFSDEGLNPAQVVDRASRVFNKVRAKRLMQEMQDALDDSNLELFHELRSGTSKIELGQDSFTSVFNDSAAIEEMFDSSDESIINFDKHPALRQFLGDTFCRDAFVAFLACEKRGKCVGGNTLLVMGDGSMKTIAEVVNNKYGDTASYNDVSRKIALSRITQFMDSGVKRCYKVTTRSGKEIVCSEDHKFLTQDGWKPLKHITTEDYVASSKKCAIFGNKRMKDEEVKFLAYMLADGSVTSIYRDRDGIRTHCGYNCNFTKTDPVIVKDFENTCNKLGFRYTRRRIANYLRGEAKQFLEKFNLMGKLSKNKTIPEEIFTCPRDQIALFLRVFFSCDGHISKNSNCIELTLASKTMLRQISHLLTRFGIVHCFRFKLSKANGKEFPSWRILIRDAESINLFVKEINMLSYKKRTPKHKVNYHKSFLDKLPWQVAENIWGELLKEYKNDEQACISVLGGKNVCRSIRFQTAKKLPIMRQSYSKSDPKSETVRKYLEADVLWDRVMNIEDVGDQQTYDIEVEGTHNFLADDIVVHNSMFMQEVCMQALRSRRRVMMFQVGDMTRAQVMRRIAARVSYRTFKAKSVLYPISIERQDKKVLVTRELRRWDDALELADAKRLFKEWQIRQTKSEGDNFVLHCSPSGSMTVSKIRSLILQKQQVSGWLPDLVCIDYADLLNTSTTMKDNRDKVNSIWSDLRGLSQELHCLVLTATQANADSYNRSSLGMRNFSEDKRKNAHATAIIAINQTTQEKKDGLIRLGFVVLREDDFHIEEQCHVATCFGVCNPMVLSIM